MGISSHHLNHSLHFLTIQDGGNSQFKDRNTCTLVFWSTKDSLGHGKAFPSISSEAGSLVHACTFWTSCSHLPGICFYLHLPSCNRVIETTYKSNHSQLGAGDPNSGLPTYTSGSLSTESCPQPMRLFQRAREQILMQLVSNQKGCWICLFHCR